MFMLVFDDLLDLVKIIAFLHFTCHFSEAGFSLLFKFVFKYLLGVVTFNGCFHSLLNFLNSFSLFKFISKISWLFSSSLKVFQSIFSHWNSLWSYVQDPVQWSLGLFRIQWRFSFKFCLITGIRIGLFKFAEVHFWQWFRRLFLLCLHVHLQCFHSHSILWLDSWLRDGGKCFLTRAAMVRFFHHYEFSHGASTVWVT